MIQRFIDWLISLGVSPILSGIPGIVLASLDAVLLGLFSYLFAKHIILRIITKIVRKTKNRYDDVLLENKVFKRIPHLFPVVVLLFSIHIVFSDYQNVVEILNRILFADIVILVMLTINSFLTSTNIIYRSLHSTMKLPVTALVQGLKIILSLLALLVVIAILINKSPLIIVSGFGALTAILMLIFKDSLLGFVAGIQLTLNGMVDYNNWIEMPKYGADGTVEEITLTTVKVRNWDKTITMVPTYALMSESFKNWKGMTESGGRRIKRSIYIDTQSITLCSPGLLEKLGRIQLISEYLKNRQEEIDTDNKEKNIDFSNPVNGRCLTNIGIFRVYIESYLKNNPMISDSMTSLVRQLQSSPNGLPIEIYIFCNEIQWILYEAVQADIFDHLFAVVKEFDLRIYQNPSGGDLGSAVDTLSGKLME